MDDARFSGAVKSASAVCIKMANGTELCRQFSSIYPVVLVPSVYFIDSANGVDVEIVGGEGRTIQELEKAVEKALAAIDKRKARHFL